MTRLHADPVEVRRHDEAPEQFLWRGRLYLVREILACWTEAGQWWAAAAVRASLAGDSLPTTCSSTSLQQPAPDVGAPVGPTIDDREQEWWRVEAACGQSAARGVYDLCFDWSSGAWSLVRVLD